MRREVFRTDKEKQNICPDRRITPKTHLGVHFDHGEVHTTKNMKRTVANLSELHLLPVKDSCQSPNEKRA